jgi:acylphosphatase
MKRANIIARGKVQKAGYRDYVQDCARELGITGYVENLEDGTVKVVCEGKETKIEDFIRDIKVKKDFIDVLAASVEYEAPTGEFKLFKIKYGDVPEELGDRLGAALLYLGATNQKIDATNQKIDAGFKMLGEKQDRMLEKQDVMIEMQDDTIEEIRSLREDLKTYMENKFAKIEHEIEGIKAKIGMV